jgi:hypothetical protein
MRHDPEARRAGYHTIRKVQMDDDRTCSRPGYWLSDDPAVTGVVLSDSRPENLRPAGDALG